MKEVRKKGMKYWRVRKEGINKGRKKLGGWRKEGIKEVI